MEHKQELQLVSEDVPELPEQPRGELTRAQRAECLARAILSVEEAEMIELLLERFRDILYPEG